MTTAHRIPKQSIDTQGITTKAMKHSKSPTSSAHRNSLSSFKFLMSNYLPPTLCFSRSGNSFRSSGGGFIVQKERISYLLPCSTAYAHRSLTLIRSFRGGKGAGLYCILMIFTAHPPLSVYLYWYYIKYPPLCPCMGQTKIRFRHCEK